MINETGRTALRNLLFADGQTGKQIPRLDGHRPMLAQMVHRNTDKERTMTREEAKKMIESMGKYLAEGNPIWDVEPVKEATRMAIEALSADMYCPNCGARLVTENEYEEPQFYDEDDYWNGRVPIRGRLIDADTLSKKLCETTIFIKDGEVFQRMINDAPTVPVVDIIQRDLCADISCTDCPFMQETCKLMDYVAYADRSCGVWEYTEITTDNDTYSEWVCSECGGSGYELMDFCPWCGADMRKEKE